MSDVILSIKPEFTKLILLGKKTIELRKRVGKQFSPGCDLYIYASSPQKAIVGKAIISSIDYADIDVIIKRYLTQTCVEESFIRGYYKNHRKGVLVSICNVVKFSSPLALSELRTFGFHPPQSFCYVSEESFPDFEERYMIIGVFGLSGVGKTTICSEIHRSIKNVKRISASDVIRMYGNSVKFEMLNQSNVDANQLVLIKGIQQLKEESKLNGGVTTYLLELHNVLETPSGLKEISINIFRQLGLDEAIFLVKPASIIVEQRQKDAQRKRVLATEKELFAIQEQAIMLFNSMFSQLDIPHEVVTDNHVEALTRVIYNSR